MGWVGFLVNGKKFFYFSFEKSLLHIHSDYKGYNDYNASLASDFTVVMGFMD